MSKLMRITIYAAGQILLAFGLTLNAKVGLGVSPLVAIAFTGSTLCGVSFADMTFIMYGLFIAIELTLHLIRKQALSVCLRDILQMPLALVFTRLMSVFDGILPNIELNQLSSLLQIIIQLGLLLVAIAAIGIGACAAIKMRILPNPGDGIVLAIADFTGKQLSTVKIIFDICNVAVAVLLGCIFAGKPIGVGIGTILAMLGVGRVISLTTRLIFSKPYFSLD